jgi:hypothetical protein
MSAKKTPGKEGSGAEEASFCLAWGYWGSRESLMLGERATALHKNCILNTH